MNGQQGYRFDVYSRRTLRGTRHYFRLRAPNGEIVLQSQGYKRREYAMAAVGLIKREAESASVRPLP